MAHQGFTTWRPTGDSEIILNAVLEVFREYRDHLPLTGRQVFYRLVGAYGYEKSDRAANKLYGVLGRARRAGLIQFSWLRDGGGQTQVPQTYADETAFWDGVQSDFDHYSRDRQSGQPTFIELFCEAPGMMPQLTRIAFRYSVPVYGTRGFTGLSVVSEIARRALTRDVPTTILQVGDLDPSGVSIFESMSGDAATFVNQVVQMLVQGKDPTHSLAKNLGVSEEAARRIETGYAEPSLTAERIALTWAQVEEHDLPTAPPSSKDSRSKTWVGETAQAEALPPDLLAEIVEDAILERMDRDRLEEELDAERADRDAIGERIPS